MDRRSRLSSASSEDESVHPLDKKKRAYNSVFGLRHWEHNLGDIPQSPSIQKGETTTDWEGFTFFANIVWVVVYGWWMACLFFILSGLMALTVVGVPYANFCWVFGKYLLWPYEKYIIERCDGSRQFTEPCNNEIVKKMVYCLWVILLACVVLIPFAVSMALNWFFVISIPMSKMIYQLIKICFTKNPSDIQIATDYNVASAHDVLVCTYKCVNYFYFRYKVAGMNIVFFNLLPFVIMRVCMVIVVNVNGYRVFPIMGEFFLDLICIIPITFYIGNAISSIASQTNYMLGALLNVTFGSLVDSILFAFAIRKGGFGDLVKYSITGGFMLNLLLIPGLSMIAGGIKYPNQKFNPVAAGVGSILLWIAIVGVLSPTIFYEAFGRYNEECDKCVLTPTINKTTTHLVCTGCQTSEIDFATDPLFEHGVRKLMYFIAAILPLAYFTGLLFTFKTHAHIFTQDEEEEEEGDGSPAWSIKFNICVLAVATTIAGLLADDIVNLIELIEDELGLGQAFLGISLIAIIPAVTELVNAIKFALHNQIALSLEIGSSGAIQAALIQVPLLVVLGATLNPDEQNPFNLIFSLFSVFAVMISVITFNYISQDGKTNYFIGTALLVIYMILVASFFFVENKKPTLTTYFIQEVPLNIKDL
eukprot:TRINITY_DN5749_c0_g1_i1.p1 TRINITY_DN5749_c0_g1~~TRINITY_DN5749_c0_g1_i1.p1  ORF type:complete len:647 (-),score=127.09 TRINITY_DN5749_c0_g1_i1:1490-3430(-)